MLPPPPDLQLPLLREPRQQPRRNVQAIVVRVDVGGQAVLAAAGATAAAASDTEKLKLLCTNHPEFGNTSFHQKITALQGVFKVFRVLELESPLVNQPEGTAGMCP